MSTVFNGEYQNFTTGVSGGWGLKNVEIELSIPSDLSGADPGKVYYIKSDDTLIMEITNTPYYQVLAGGVLGWSYDFNILTGGDSNDTNNTEYILYSTIPLNEDEGYNNVDVYKNGELMENSPSGDFIIQSVSGEEGYQIFFNYSLEDTDRLVMVISSRPSLNNYVTKFSLKEFLENVNMSIVPDENRAYDIGAEEKLFENFYVKKVNGPETDKLVLNGNIEIIGDLKVGGVEHTSSNTNLTDEHLVIRYSDLGSDGDASLDIRRYPQTTGDVEITEVTFPPNNDSDLNGTYWTLSSALDETKYYIWYHVNGETETDPSIDGATGLKVVIDSDVTAKVVATETRTQINSTGDFNTSIEGSRITITNIDIGPTEGAQDETTGLTDLNTIQSGTINYEEGERDSKLFWNDTTHLWQLKYGEEGNIVSNIVTEDDGNAPSSSKLINPRTIGITGDGTADGVAFDGTGNIVLDLNVHSDTHDHANGISGNAGSADKLATARTIGMTGDIVTNDQNFDGTSNISISSTVTGVRGINFHKDSTDPTGETRLNMEGYFYATRVYNAVYNDLAEFMSKAEEAEAGEVMVQTKDGLVKSSKRADKRVIGVYSDSFGYALGAEDQENKIPIGISGTVWVKIEGKFKIGDMVTSYKNGKAIKANLFEKIFKQDTLIGKILEDNKKNNRVKILIK